MKRILVLIIASSLLLSGCKFLNEKVFKKGEQEEQEQLALELKKVQAENEQHKKELTEMKRISQAKIDSIINYYESELADQGPHYGTAGAGNYYLIVGSFKTPEFAEDYAKKISEMGYAGDILTKGHWNFVSAESYNNIRDAIEGLEIVRGSVSVDSWILKGN